MVFVLLLAVSLSVDALGIGISYGLRKIRFSPAALAILAAEGCGMMQVFLWLGRLFSGCFPAGWAEAASPVFLLGCGVWLCLQGTGRNKTGKADSPLHAPSLCDKDASAMIEPKEAFLLGLLLSLDSFAIGMSAAASGMDTAGLPLFAALFQTAFLGIGSFCGGRLLLRAEPRESLWSLLSGGILILLAAARLLGQ